MTVQAIQAILARNYACLLHPSLFDSFEVMEEVNTEKVGIHRVKDTWVHVCKRT
jgi:hypothetical protein